MRRKDIRECVPHLNPLEPPDYVDREVLALRALATGTASEEQQKEVIDFLLRICGTYDLAFRPGGHDGERLTNVAIGKARVGQNLLYLLKHAQVGEQSKAHSEARKMEGDNVS